MASPTHNNAFIVIEQENGRLVRRPFQYRGRPVRQIPSRRTTTGMINVPQRPQPQPQRRQVPGTGQYVVTHQPLRGSTPKVQFLPESGTFLVMK